MGMYDSTLRAWAFLWISDSPQHAIARNSGVIETFSDASSRYACHAREATKKNISAMELEKVRTSQIRLSSTSRKPQEANHT